ncbi:MAG: hypothetical protein ACRCTY_02285 [Candidatus Adiutrix sp.]
MKRKKIYVCSPYAGDVDANVEMARVFCRKAMEDGHAPFASHLMYPGVVNDLIEKDRARGIACGLTFMESCDEMWAYVGKGISEGMALELEHALKIGIPVKYFNICEVEHE